MGQDISEPASTILYTEIAAYNDQDGLVDPTQSDFYGAHFSPDNLRLAIWGDGFIYIYNIANHQMEDLINSMIDYPEWLQWKSDSTALLLSDGGL